MQLFLGGEAMECGQFSGSYCFLSQLCYFCFGDLKIMSNDFDNECKNANLLILAHVQQRETCPVGRGQVSYFAFHENTQIWHRDALGLLFS